MRTGAVVNVVAAVATAIVAIAARWVVAPAGITNDGPQHLWAAFVRVHDVAGYVVNHPPSANGGVQLLEALLWAGLSPVMALAVGGAIGSVVVAAGFAAMCLAQHPGRWPVAVLGVGLSQQLATVAGTIPYSLALGAASILVAARARPGAWSRRALLLWTLALLVVGWLHIVPAFLALAFGVLVAVTEAPRDLRRLAANAGAGAPLVLLIAASALEPGDHGVRAALFAPRLDLIGALLPQAIPAEWPLYAVVAIAAIAAVRRRTPAGLRGAGAGLALMVFATVLADDALGWNLMRERLWALGAMCVLATLAVERWRPALQVACAAGAVVWSAAVLVASVQSDVHVAAFTRPVLATTAGLGPVVGRWAPVVSVSPSGDEPRRGRLAAWLHIGQVAATSIGGQPAFSQDGTAAIHSILRPEAEPAAITNAPSPALWPRLWDAPRERRASVVSAYAAWGATIPRLVVYGPLAEQGLFVARGHVVEQTTPPDALGNVAFVTRFVGCDIEARLAGPVRDSDVLEVGFFPAGEALSTFPVAQGRDVVHLHGIPCGDGLWFRLQRGPCREAQPGTRLPLPSITPDSTADLACTPVP